MAIYHFSGQILGRSSGQNPDGSPRPGAKAAAAAAYRSGSQVRDYRTGEVHDYSRRKGIAHSEIMVPPGAAPWLEDRELLWGTVERMEARRDAQLAREFNMALPHELDAEQRLELVRSFVQRHFVGRGMVADIALHEPVPEHGQSRLNFHAHVMLTLRKATPDGLHPVKTREWNSKELLNLWRAEWALACNQALARAGQRVRVDHRTLEAQRDEAVRRKDVARAAELNRAPEIHVGPKARTLARRRLEPKSRVQDTGPARRPAKTLPAQRRRRDYPARDRGTRLSWLETILAGNNDKLKRDLEGTNRRFDRLSRKLDYWERRATFRVEGLIGGKQFRFLRWQKAQAEAEAARKAAHARKRVQQLRALMQLLDGLLMGQTRERERRLARTRQVQTWREMFRPRGQGRGKGRGRLF